MFSAIYLHLSHHSLSIYFQGVKGLVFLYFATCVAYTENTGILKVIPLEGEIDNNTLLESNDPNNVAFYLYPNTENLNDYDEISLNDRDSLTKSRYNPRQEPIFLIHGFLNNFTTRYSQTFKNAFLRTGYSSRNNIIVVDWGKLSTPANQTAWAVSHINDLNQDLFYQAAVANVPKVGNRISEFINFLVEEKFLRSPADVHLIGFSLGAQISGAAGYYMKQNGSIPIGRITGLDPAGPLYQTASVDQKLDSTDGSFVLIVHSNQGQDGYYGSIGHADFYPNGGGPNQPDCLDVSVGVVGDTISGSCAHNRAWIYYIKSLTEQIQTCKCFSQADVICKVLFCSTKALFGHMCPDTTRGSYYFDITMKEQ